LSSTHSVSPRPYTYDCIYIYTFSRANNDAVNVHPLEFFLGEYNHLWSLFLCCRLLNLQIHALGTILFLAVGGILAGWNHTRYDITVPLFGFGSINIFDSKLHDVHHRIPQSNYGQYTMFWDWMFGTYRYVDTNGAVCGLAYILYYDVYRPSSQPPFVLYTVPSSHETVVLLFLLVDYYYLLLRSAYDPKDRVNPKAQLDPKTGKSMESVKSQ
jgi:hypothetical protein